MIFIFMSHLFIVIIEWRHCSHACQLEWSQRGCTHTTTILCRCKRSDCGEESNDDDCD